MTVCDAKKTKMLKMDFKLCIKMTGLFNINI